jgi:hypothetical protein
MRLTQALVRCLLLAVAASGVTAASAAAQTSATLVVDRDVFAGAARRARP